MANEILLLNPRRKKRRTKKRTAKKTATKRKRITRRPRRSKPRARARARKNPTVIKMKPARRSTTMARKKKRSTKRRRNPSPRRKAIARRATGMLGRSVRQILDSLKGAPLGALGMLASKWAAKLGSPDALQSDPSTWDWSTYLKGAGGTIGAGLLVGSWRPAAGKKVMEGGFALMLYELLQHEVFPKSTWLTNQFGQDDWTALGETVQPMYQPGDVEYNSEGRPYLLGEDNEWYPLDEESSRMGEDVYNRLEPPGPLGDALETPGRLGFGQVESAYANALFRR